MKRHFYYLIIIALLSFIATSISHAEMKTFEKEYTYQASEQDSKVSCRKLALEETKRLLLEELGTYLESQTEVKNYQLTKDQITAFTAGITKAVIIKENWDGQRYYLKAMITTDPEGVVKAINDLRKDRQKERELQDERKRTEDALKRIEQLKIELAQNKQDSIRIKQYKAAIRELTSQEYVEKGRNLLNSNKYKEAQVCFKEAIKLNPVNPWAYYYIGMANKILGKNREAINNFNMAIKQDNSFSWAYYNRGLSYNRLGNKKQGLADINEAARLGDRYAQKYLEKRGIKYENSISSSKAVYVSSKNSNKFHKPDCEWAKKIAAKNRIQYRSIEEAKAARKIPCKICMPETVNTKSIGENDPVIESDQRLDREE